MTRRQTTSTTFRLLIVAALVLTGSFAAPVRAGKKAPPEDPHLRSMVRLHAQGRLFEAESRWSDAAEAYRQAVLEAHEQGRADLVAALLLAAGDALLEDRRIQDAVVAYEKGLEALAVDHRFELGELLDDLRLLEKGVERVALWVPDDLYTSGAASSLREAAADPELDARLLFGIANAYLEQPQTEVALEHYERALDRATEPSLRAGILSNTGTALRRMARLAEAQARFAESLQLFAQIDRELDGRAALSGLASIQLERGELDSARATYRRAVELYARAGDESGLAKAVTGLARCELLSERFERAVAEFERAKDLAESTFDREALLHIRLGLGVAYRKVGRLQEAARSLDAALPEINVRRGNLSTDEGRIAFLDTAAAVYDELLELHLERAQTDPGAWSDALHVSEISRGRALADLVGHRRRTSVNDPTEMFVQAARGTPASGGGPADVRPNQGIDGTPVASAPNAAGINAPVDDFRQVAAGTPSASDLEFAFEPEILEPVEYRDPPPVSRLSFHVLEGSTAVFWVGADGGVRGHLAPLGRADLAARVAELRAGLGIDTGLRGVRGVEAVAARPERAPQEILGDLGRDLLGPFEAQLSSDQSPLALVLHGPLWTLPVAALTGADGEPLIARRPLLFSPSWDLLEGIRARKPRGLAELSVLAVGNPAFPSSVGTAGLEFEPLPGAEVEARAVDEMCRRFAVPSELLTGEQATRDRVVSSLADHRIIHLATHGVASDENPLSSFLLFAADATGDRLEARTVIRDLDVPAELVVLSACQTGLGRLTGDGMIGLSRSFLAAGARTVVVSLWSVSDDATEALMTSFYRAYLGGASKAAALRQAMLELRRDPDLSSPALWAPFILIGAED